MIYSVHHTHKHGVTLTVLHKDLANANHWFASEGHTTCKEFKDKTCHYFIEVSHEVVDLEGED